MRPLTAPIRLRLNEAARAAVSERYEHTRAAVDQLSDAVHCQLEIYKGGYGERKRLVRPSARYQPRQPNRLDIGKGICIVDGGLGGKLFASIYYGPITPSGPNLSACSMFKLSFAGNVTASELVVDLLVVPHGKASSDLQQFLPPALDAVSLEFPLSRFVPPLQPADLSNLNEIGLLLYAGRTITYGLHHP